MTETEYFANVTARFGKPPANVPLYAWLADMENAACKTKPPMNLQNRKNVSQVRMVAILDHIRNNAPVTVAAVAAALGFGADIARVGMSILERQGLVVRGERATGGALWTATE